MRTMANYHKTQSTDFGNANSFAGIWPWNKVLDKTLAVIFTFHRYKFHLFDRFKGGRVLCCAFVCVCLMYVHQWPDLWSQLNRATQTAVATSRICQLAQPKRRPVLEGSGHKSKPVPMTHLPCKASAHIELLASRFFLTPCGVLDQVLHCFCSLFDPIASVFAAPKHDHPGFEGERSVCWLVSRAARHYNASQRLLELSSPKERKALFEGYDPYTVSRAARSASPSPRIRQLCLPLPRKCSSN